MKSYIGQKKKSISRKSNKDGGDVYLRFSDGFPIDDPEERMLFQLGNTSHALFFFRDQSN